MAVAVEDVPNVLVLDVDSSENRILLLQRLAVPGLAAPAHVTFDTSGRLWVLGRGESGLAAGVASPTQEPDKVWPIAPQ